MGVYDGNFVTLASVRRTSGIASTEINDADVKAIIDECEPQIERFYNTKFTPTEKIEVRDGTGTSTMMLRKNPVLSIRDLYINGTQEDVDNLDVYRESGKIMLNSGASATTFIQKSRKIVIKYVYGNVEESSTSTTTDAASVAGTSVALSVASETGFATGDWVQVSGMDGYEEAAEITGTDTGEITVDSLTYGHVLGSTVTLLKLNETYEKLINYACSLALVARIVGQSYSDTVGYGLGELNIQKGEPYTQWRETATQLIKERDLIMSQIRPRWSIQ